MILSKYLTREIMQTVAAVIVVLMLAFLSQQVVRYLNYAAIGKIATNILLLLVSFEIPYLLALLMPLALYLGILLTMGRLHADNEMAVMQMGGYHYQRILRLIASIALAIAGVVLCLMLWVNPWISAMRQQLMESGEATLHLIETLIPGKFQVSADGKHVMYVEKISRDHTRAENVFIAEAVKETDHPNRMSWMIVNATEGYQTKSSDSNDQFFVTTDGYRYQGMPGENDFTITQYKKYDVRIPAADNRASHAENESLPTTRLWADYQDPKRAAELQWRFSIAISTFILALLAVPFSAIKPRKGRYVMLLPAVLVYMVYIDLLYVARHWVEAAFVPITLGIWWVHAVFLLLLLLALLVKSKN